MLHATGRVPNNTLVTVVSLQPDKHGRSNLFPYVCILLMDPTAADAIKELWYPPLVSEVSRRGRFMYQFHKEVMSPLHGTPQDPFGGVDIDLSGLGISLTALRCTWVALAP